MSMHDLDGALDKTCRLALVFTLLVAHFYAQPTYAADPCITPLNSIIGENCLPGTAPSVWNITGSGDPTIQGFATDMSFNRGQTVLFKIKTDTLSYTVDIYRLGYYGGLGARKVASFQRNAQTPQIQPTCLKDSSVGLIDCGNWVVSTQWQIPSTVTSGIYFAKLTRNDTGGASHVFFVVRNDTGNSNIVYQTSDTTWQAYNTYGDVNGSNGINSGASLYQNFVFPNLIHPYKVSYNRPFVTRVNTGRPGDSTDVNFFFDSEYPMVRWLERNGYDVSYISGIDTDRSPTSLLSHKVFVSSGHDEYWSRNQRNSVTTARNSGVSLAFFSGNEMFWKTRLEPSIDGTGTANRTLVTYKTTETGASDPLGGVWTGTWRDPSGSSFDAGQPENALIGVQFIAGLNVPGFAIQVPGSYGKLRFWRNTNVAALTSAQSASLAPATLGFEFDTDADNGLRPSGLFDLSATTLTAVPNVILDAKNHYGTANATHHMTLYRHPSQALVFASGTIRWSWGLDTVHDSGPSTESVTMQQATANLFADMGALPGSLQTGVVMPTKSTDTTPPLSAITSPKSGASISGLTTITGTASDTFGVVAAIEVSTDGGVTWSRANGTSNWTYVDTFSVNPLTIKSRAIDDSGNVEIPNSGIVINAVTSSPNTFLVGTLERATSVINWDEFTNLQDAPTYVISSGSASDVREWIGVSACPACTLNKKSQQLTFNNLITGRSYAIAVSPGWVTDDGTISYQAVVTAGNATISSLPRVYTGSGYRGASDVWNISFIPSSTSVTLSLGNNATSGYHYMYFDAISGDAGSASTTPPTPDLTAPVSVINAPTAGTIASGSVTLSGAASDSGGSVTKVEISTDNGTTWQLTSGTTNWTYAWNAAATGTRVIKSRATDASGNIEIPSAGVTVTIVTPSVLSFTAGTLLASNTTDKWLEFTSALDNPTYSVGTATAADVRPWIGSSQCPACTGANKSQNIAFSNLTPGQTYSFKVYPGWVTDVDVSAQYQAIVKTGSATITSGVRTYSGSGYRTVNDFWTISFIAGTPAVTLSLGNNAFSGYHYMYFDAISTQ